MDVAAVILRLIHIVCGVFWAGALLFVAIFLEPSVREAGPKGASVMQGIVRRGFLTVTPVVAGLTILSGIDLMRRVSGGFTPGWFGTPSGLTLTVGAAAAFIGFGIGVGVMRPSVLRVGRLVKAAEEATDTSTKEGLLAQVGMLRRRTMLAGRWVAALLTLSVVTMAIARYLSSTPRIRRGAKKGELPRQPS